MNLLKERLTNNKRRGVSSLVLFLTGGYPTLDSTVDLVLRLEDGGADAVEMAWFSDPMADGPMIQRSSAVALANGVTDPWMLEQVSVLHERTSSPLYSRLGYVKPIYCVWSRHRTYFVKNAWRQCVTREGDIPESSAWRVGAFPHNR